jgi:hypothetical protein
MDWQTIIALSTVTIAGLALLPRIFGVFRANQKPGCGSCGGCSSNAQSAKPKAIIGLKEIVDRRSERA